jgi:hypothetical protein
MRKTCYVCCTEKNINDFHRHTMMTDGHLNICITCNTARMKARYANNKQNPLFVLVERKRSREKMRRKVRVKPTTEKRAGYEAKHKLKNADKVSARRELNNAVKRGDIKQMPCEVCGNETAEGHHYDYTKPLDVRWLCTTHHNKHHVTLREQELIGSQ